MEWVLVRYGELFLKSEPVKRHYIRILLNNIAGALAAYGLEAETEVHRGRVLVGGQNPEEIAAAISRVFGVIGVSRCVRTAPDRDEIEEAAVHLAMKSLQTGKSIAVRARRAGMKGFTSQELGASIGAKILDEQPGLSVDLKNPDYEIFVEARDFGGLIYDAQQSGPGGVPLGTQGRVLSLLSAGIDSPVATWLTMRRGCTVSCLHFDGGSRMGADVGRMTFENLSRLSEWSPGIPVTMMVADLQPFFDRLIEIPDVKYRCILCKRFMYRTGAELARTEGCRALVTGDNLGQVASQTLVNIGVIEEAVPRDLPVIRPLITYDKQETVDLARSIGTFCDSPGDLSCSVVPRHPAITAELDPVLESEKRIDIGQISGEIRKNLRYYRALNGEITEIRSP